MLILGIDSSAVSVSAAVISDDRVIAEGFVNNRITHSQTLLPLVQSLLNSSKLTASDIDVFAVSAGPGSFTGLRIGISAVKGMAYALGKPCRAVSTLHAMAYNFTLFDGIVCAAMDARRSQVYNALFEVKNGTVSRLTEDRAISTEALKAELEARIGGGDGGKAVLCGDGAGLCAASFGDMGGKLILAPAPLRYQKGTGVCLAAAEYPDVTAAALMPTYLRLSQAERERAERENAVR